MLPFLPRTPRSRKTDGAACRKRLSLTFLAATAALQRNEDRMEVKCYPSSQSCLLFVGQSHVDQIDSKIHSSFAYSLVEAQPVQKNASLPNETMTVAGTKGGG